MKWYYAINAISEAEVVAQKGELALASFHYFKGEKNRLYLKQNKGRFAGLFIDSGAFSAMTIGAEIQVDDYVDFLRYIEPAQAAALDVIGDEKKTWENTKYMSGKGIDPLLPTFHISDNDWSYLDKMILEYDYIALGGLVGIPKKKSEAFADRAWGRILKLKPDLKVHGFGLSELQLMLRYPWTSVDSTSHKAPLMFGWFTFYDEKFRRVKKQKMEPYLKLKFGEEILQNSQRLRHEAQLTQLREYQRQTKFVTEQHKKTDFGYLLGQRFF